MRTHRGCPPLQCVPGAGLHSSRADRRLPDNRSQGPDPQGRAARPTAAFDYSALMNDVYSYQKEVEYEGELLNMLVVTETFFGCDYRAALGVVNDLMTSRTKQFEHVLEKEFPAMYRDFGLDAAARTALDRYAEELKQWMAAIATWHAGTRRYREEDLKRHHARRTEPVAAAGALPRAPHRAGWRDGGDGAVPAGRPRAAGRHGGGRGPSPESDIPLAFRQN
ncbi:hypothetical protein AB0I68_07385 [Streptomyces sp. NPDC050448]|uniref:terpene synthase family protein n=1 Tax=Streptomyces sp. NPDC050448 TaxID=3155404 RepID=UPI00341E07A7